VGAAEQASDAMRSVRDSSHEVSTAIRDLATKSGQIGAIVETITGIAEQTNLLALNAAIEAARAGEQGRGFAVVAEEVRKLAEEAQRSAHEISDLIGAIQNETTNTVDVVENGAKRTLDGAAVVEQTREAFLQIGTSVEDMTSRIEQIAAVSEEIAASAQSMQESIGEAAAVAEQSSASTEEVSASTQETSASAQEIAASARQLSGNAETLNRLVEQFRLNA
jgi:methyl-accepting chemotaxis protein